MTPLAKEVPDPWVMVKENWYGLRKGKPVQSWAGYDRTNTL